MPRCLPCLGVAADAKVMIVSLASDIQLLVLALLSRQSKSA